VENDDFFTRNRPMDGGEPLVVHGQVWTHVGHDGATCVIRVTRVSSRGLWADVVITHPSGHHWRKRQDLPFPHSWELLASAPDKPGLSSGEVWRREDGGVSLFLRVMSVAKDGSWANVRFFRPNQDHMWSKKVPLPLQPGWVKVA
jgi:hypothetical protein